jgi:BirA family biotin operon repressor/biotin-[acetyl-CoA-carboxylase] ligase
MRRPTGQIRQIESVDSTQAIVADELKEGRILSIVLADFQSAGRGRFDRVWVSSPGESLMVSMAFPDYADHPRPHLIGMAIAVAAAGVLHCQLQWPNDLVLNGKKLGGILTEIITDVNGRRVPVVGVGINLRQSSFPPELAHATSIAMERGSSEDPLRVLNLILFRLDLLPEPNSWADLAPTWMLFDRTPGKQYKLQDGRQGVAIGIGPEGQLLCAVDGESTSVLAADAIFGG